MPSQVEILKMRVLKTLLVVGTFALIGFWQTERYYGVLGSFDAYAYPALILFYSAITLYLFLAPHRMQAIAVITIWVLAVYFVITHWLFFISTEYGLLQDLNYQQTRLVQWYILIFITSFVFFETKGALRSSVLFYLSIALPELIFIVNGVEGRDPAVSAAAIVALISNPVYIVCLWGVALIKEHLNEVHDHAAIMAEAAAKDALTGVLNRRGLMDIVKDYQQKSSLGVQSCALILFDVDHFKKINDELGHDRGDETLIALTKLTQNHLRGKDHLARWGGEEFLIFSPDLSQDNAAKLAERLRSDLEAQSEGVLDRVTASYGVHSFKMGEPFEDAVKKADEALYQAKGSGRNKVVVY